MDIGTIAQLILLIFLILMSTFSSCSETALTTVNRIRIRTLAEDGNKKAERVLAITDNTAKFLSAILILNNIANIGASALATSLTIKLVGNRWVGLATGILTLVVLIFGEITPKTAAANHAESLSMRVSGPVKFFVTILTPVIFLVNVLSNGILKILRINTEQGGDTVTEEELRTLLDVGHDSGVLEDDEHEMVHNIFELGDTQVHDIMIPRFQVSLINVNATYHEVMDLYRKVLYTRFPVYEENEDHIIGIINMKDLLLCENRDTWSARDILRKPYFTFENKNTSDLLVEMRAESINLALVLDEYGDLAGILTLEDLLEEIVGEIHDEYDEAQDSGINRVNDREYLVEGSINLEDFCEETGLSLISEDYDSLGGFIIEHLGRIPKVNDTITTEDGVRLRVTHMDDMRIAQIRVSVLQDSIQS